jgi:hypothetical protein
MKKLILSLVFVLATGTSFMNASSNEKNIYGESCYEKADRLTIKSAIWLNLDLDQEHALFGILYDDCMNEQNGEFVF